MRLTKKDLSYALVTGCYTGLIAWLVTSWLHFQSLFGFSYAWLMLLLPLLWLAGVWLGYLLGHWLTFFNQFGKYAAIGFTNFAVDLGALNVLIFFTGVTGGRQFVWVRGTAAVLAVVHSFFWNRYWVFGERRDQSIGRQAVSFALAASIAAAVNIGIATGIVNYIRPLSGFTPERWDNVAAIIGSAVALAVNFVILRQKVFNRSNVPDALP